MSKKYTITWIAKGSEVYTNSTDFTDVQLPQAIELIIMKGGTLVAINLYEVRADA